MSAQPAQKLVGAKRIMGMIRHDEFWKLKRVPIGKRGRAKQVVSCVGAVGNNSKIKRQSCTGQCALEKKRVVFGVFNQENDRMSRHVLT